MHNVMTSPLWRNGLPFFCTYLFSILSIFGLQAHAYTALSDDALGKIPGAGADFDVHDGALLAPILIPRVPGTPGSLKVRKHFLDFFSAELPEWKIDIHNSTSKTPATGDRDVPFVNIIARRDPPWAGEGDVARLTLVAHYDSKYKPEGFIGATDSAAPCAILMHVARSLDVALTEKWEAMRASGDVELGLEEEEGIQIILLDGEEAFETWTATDSLYGASALAESWDTYLYDPMSTYPTPLASISLFVLLDLLGAKEPRVSSYFESTHWAYQNLAKVESRMRALGQLQTKPAKAYLPESEKLAMSFARGFVEDDHIPFMQRGVPILHVIPHPFPRVWHTMDDDAAHLDIPTTDDWAKIMTAFAAEWMELGEFISSAALKQPKREGNWRDKTEL